LERQEIVFWLFACPGLGLGLFFLMREVLEHRLTAWEFTFGAAMLFLLVAGAWRGKGTPVAPILMAGVWLSSLYIALTALRLARMSDRPILERELLRAQRALMYDPQNPAARTYLGELYVKLGRLEEGIRELEEAVRLRAGQTARATLEKALEIKRARETGMYPCPLCQHLNPLASSTCVRCGAIFSEIGFLAEEMGLIYRGRPRWLALLLFLPLIALGVTMGRAGMQVILVGIGISAIFFLTWLLNLTRSRAA